jgi:hypothetical protein
MKDIEIVFTKSKKKFAILSKLIMWYTNKPYSHVARKAKLSLLQYPHYYQASEGKVNYEYEDFFNKKHEIVKSYTIQVPAHFYEELIKESWMQVGNKYGTMQNVGILLVDLLAKIGIIATNPFKKGMNCSELIFRTVFSKIIPNLPYRADQVKPHQIEDIIINYKLHKKDIN